MKNKQKEWHTATKPFKKVFERVKQPNYKNPITVLLVILFYVVCVQKGEKSRGLDCFCCSETGGKRITDWK
jgi:hypothetical protein